MGLCVLNIASFLYLDKQFPNKDELKIIGKIVSIKEEKEYYDKYILKVISNPKYKNTKGSKIIIYVEKEIDLIPGDIVEVNGNFSKAEESRNYKSFNYRKYLKQSKVFGILKCEYIEKIGKSESVYTKILELRLKLCTDINNIYTKECASFLNGLLFGKTDELSENVENDFKDSNISHILAISGMHVIYVIAGTKFIASKVIISKKIRDYILICFLFFFCIISGFSVSCLRSCIMYSMILLSSNLYRKNNFYTSFIFSLIIILLLNPYNLYNTGMWLSYFGTLGLVAFYNFIKSLIKHKLKKYNNHKLKETKINISECKILEYIFENFYLSLSAQILIFPIMVYVFNTISFTFFISNILVSIFIGPALILGYISLFISYIPIPFYKLFVFVEEFIIYIVLKIGELCAKLPLSKIYVPTPNFIFIILYYVIIFCVIYYFYKRKYYCLKLVLSFKFLKKEIKLNMICLNNIFGNSVLVIIIFVLLINGLTINQSLKIYFVDIGQGDCTVIQTPNNKNILIDGGEGNTEKYDYGENVLLPYLLDRGITRIDYLIISHCDSDHIGGLFAVMENIKVEKILIGIQPESSEQFEDLIDVSNENKIEIIFLKAKNKLYLEKDIKIEVLWPIENNLIQENTLNNNSLVFKLLYKDISVLFTGDIEEIAEKEILKEYENNEAILKSTILKVAHHGSKSSSIEIFLEKVNPKFALIGVGKDNKFGHPDKGVLNRLENLNSKIYRTDLNGEIIITIKENKFNIETNFK